MKKQFFTLLTMILISLSAIGQPQDAYLGLVPHTDRNTEATYYYNNDPSDTQIDLMMLQNGESTTLTVYSGTTQTISQLLLFINCGYISGPDGGWWDYPNTMFTSNLDISSIEVVDKFSWDFAANISNTDLTMNYFDGDMSFTQNTYQHDGPFIFTHYTSKISITSEGYWEWDKCFLVFPEPIDVVAGDVINVTIKNSGVGISIIGDTDLECGENSQLDVEVSELTGTISYNWADDATLSSTTIANPIATPLSTTTYFVTVTDDNDFFLDQITINISSPVAQEICMALVDSTTGNNVIVWDKAPSTSTNYYNVFRMNAFQEYDSIGHVPYDNMSLFEDSDQEVNPVIQSYRYKISSVDICGQESGLSVFHQTLHLSTSESVSPAGVNLIWVDHYIGFDFTTYNIYRGPDANSMTLLTQIANIHSSYLDINPLIGNSVYGIAAIKPGGICTPISSTRAITGPFSQSLSNIDEYILVGKNIISNDDNVSVYPNPFSSNTTISTGENNPMQSIAVMDLSGKVVLAKENINSNRVEINSVTLTSGMYLLQINATKSIFKKIIVE